MATFKARARALEMLGRQQIAGIPTAISELFKNAHDAYADRVEVDYYRTDGLFILRDDGLGMTEDDFVARWLTIGTESKLDAGAGLLPPPRAPDKPLRPIMGEKGIGRLAIATIGPQVLVLSRAKRENGFHDLVAAFIHWGLFGCPGVDLDQIEIPIRKFPAGTLPNRTDIVLMTDEVIKNAKSLLPIIGKARLDKFVAEIAQFSVDPQQLNELLGAPSLLADGNGTHFYIMPADEMLIVDIDGKPDDDDDTAPPLIKILIGFTNTMTPGHSEPAIDAHFRDHITDDSCHDLIESNEFFTPDEFREADHHIQGRFDEYGQFTGTVAVYGDETHDHVVPWTSSRGRRTDCGPFRIDLAYVQGVSRESALPTERWTAIIRKLNRIGGLYVYKDGLRVLPYGTTEHDFLGIEKNRTKSASYYYFSYRRMFGVIEISHNANPQLTEKAGREGFIENRAYRQFRDILSNFFVQIAADFFREGGVKAEKFQSRKAELDRIERARREREKQVTVRRKALRTDLDDVFKKLEAGEPEVRLAKVTEALEAELRQAVAMTDPIAAAAGVLTAEAKAYRTLEYLRSTYRVVRPRGMGLTKQLRRDWEAYVREAARIDEQVFEPTTIGIGDAVTRWSRDSHVELDRRRRLELAVQDEVARAHRVTASGVQSARETMDKLASLVSEVRSEVLSRVDQVVREVQATLARLDTGRLTDEQFAEYRERFVGR